MASLTFEVTVLGLEVGVDPQHLCFGVDSAQALDRANGETMVPSEDNRELSVEQSFLSYKGQLFCGLLCVVPDSSLFFLLRLDRGGHSGW